MEYLSNRLNISILKEVARNELRTYLQQFKGTKAIIWDDKLLSSIELVADFTFLKQCGVTKMRHLRSEKLPQIEADYLIYFLRSKASLMKIVADNLQGETRETFNKEIHILLMPYKSWLCEKKLQDYGILPLITSINEYPIEILPLDTDVISMQLVDCCKELLIEKDHSCLLHVARAIMTIQSLFGIIGNVYGQGPWSQRVFDLMTKLSKEMSLKESQVVPQIHSLLLIDRSVDFVTPLMSQMTFEGLLDEIFGINNGIIKIPSDKLNKTNESGSIRTNTADGVDPPTEVKLFRLNSTDLIYSKIRDKTFYDVGPIIRDNTKKLSVLIDERHEAKSVPEMQLFMKKLPSLQAVKNSLINQTSIAEIVKTVVDTEEFNQTVEAEQLFVNGVDTDKVNTYIEDCIARQEPLTKILRLISLQSLTNNGLKNKNFEYYVREILQTYRYKHLVTLNNLEKAGLIKQKTSYLVKSYNILRKTFRLTKEKSSGPDSDITYVYSGYAPLSVRLVEFMIYPGWRAIPEALKLLPEPTIETKQIIPTGLRKGNTSDSPVSVPTPSAEPKVVLVFFIGGVTFAEISALRLLSQRADLNVEFLIATTHIINGKTFIDSLGENFDKKPSCV
ncbi:vacuolar protein sorting-associated protein 33A [Tetranychus urticae]|uniref:Vacuolar protein sorting-associated protein 33A n=1 Tax=Tetranychus urticae TaxID=32264 RepID=T1K4T3_TETUR|nr:vacuolar protein sorting-associated protein 33A [Tetranychus urticae]